MTVTILEPTEYNFSIANVDFVFFDYYPSPFVEDHARLYTFCDHQLVRESIYKFRDGKEQSWPTIIPDCPSGVARPAKQPEFQLVLHQG